MSSLGALNSVVDRLGHAPKHMNVLNLGVKIQQNAFKSPSLLSE